MLDKMSNLLALQICNDKDGLEGKIFRIPRFIEVQCRKLEILEEMALASAPWPAPVSSLPWIHLAPWGAMHICMGTLQPGSSSSIYSPSTSHKQPRFGDRPALGVCTPAMSLTLGRIDPGKNLVQAQDKSWAIWTMNSGSQVSSIV